MVFDYDPPERFVAGTVGQPGQRQFYLQATAGGRTTSVLLEKGQVSILADRINDVLDEFGGGAASEQAAASHQDLAPLDTPVEEEFRVGTMSLAWDPEREVVIVECYAVTEDDEEPETPDPALGLLRVVLQPAYARAFARRSSKVVAAGRPQCPFCAGPLDPAGHICPRANGYRRQP